MSKKPVGGTPAVREILLSAKPSEFKIRPTPELPRVWANRQMLVLIEGLFPAFVAREAPLEVIAGAAHARC